MSRLAYLVGGVMAAIVANFLLTDSDFLLTDSDMTAVGVAADDTGTAAVVENISHCSGGDDAADGAAENSGDACT